MRDSNRSRRGKSRQEVVYRHVGHRDIGNPGDKVSMQFVDKPRSVGDSSMQFVQRRIVRGVGNPVDVGIVIEIPVAWGIRHCGQRSLAEG
jgi:hypothetical protein